MCCGNKTVEQQIGTIGPLLFDLDGIRLAAVGTRRLDATVDLERTQNAEGVPSAVGIPPVAARVHPVGRRHCRKRVRHSYLGRRWVQHERMGFVQLTPACPHLALLTQLSRRGRATELDEGRIRAITKIQ